MEVERIEKQFDDCIAFLLRVFFLFSAFFLSNIFIWLLFYRSLCYSFPIRISLMVATSMARVCICAIDVCFHVSSSILEVMREDNVCLIFLEDENVKIRAVFWPCRSYLWNSMWVTSLIWLIWLPELTTTISTCLIMETWWLPLALR
jgi:hypothetical protein